MQVLQDYEVRLWHQDMRSVSGNDYFYDNEKIELETLLQRIKKTEGRYVVEIKDEQASKKAYQALIKAFKKDGISYTEK